MSRCLREISVIPGMSKASGGDHPGMGELIYISNGNCHKGQMFLIRGFSATLNIVQTVVGYRDIDCNVELGVEITEFILDAHSTEYNWQAFYMSNAFKQLCSMLIIKCRCNAHDVSELTLHLYVYSDEFWSIPL